MNDNNFNRVNHEASIQVLNDIILASIEKHVRGTNIDVKVIVDSLATLFVGFSNAMGVEKEELIKSLEKAIK